MAKLIGKPRIEGLQDIIDMGNSSWAGAEINFHVKPEPGEEWGPDFTAGCLLDGDPAVVPGAISQLRQWDKDPENSFYCYAPMGYLRDGTRMTLRVHPRDKKGRPTEEVIWQGDFRIRLEDGEHRLEEIVSLSAGTQEQLDALPGVGPKIAEAIIAYRQMHGPFTSIEQLEDVPMVGSDKIEGLRDLVVP
ncbi:MAG: ComEA family DNA-binding protein [bacterium]